MESQWQVDLTEKINQEKENERKVKGSREAVFGVVVLQTYI